MPPFLFWIFALMLIGFGAGVIINRNPIASALSLVICFIALSALFISLDAFFIGVIQVLVYAGAVMVLFLFIIMLLDLRAEKRRKINLVAFVGGAAVALALFTQIYFVVGKLSVGNQPMPPLTGAHVDDVRSVGSLLFSNYNLPFQIIGVLVLVSTVGVIVLSKRELR